MVKTTVDVFVSTELKDDAALLTVRGSEIGGASNEVPERDLWTLRAAKTEQMVALAVEQDVEDFCHPSLGISARIAKKLKVRPGHRYALSYNEATRSITLNKNPISSGVFTIVVNNAAKIGMLLAGIRVHSDLGMPFAQIPFVCSKNGAQMTLKVKVSSNLSDFDALIVHERTAKRLGLVGGQRYDVQYNQVTKMLAIRAD